MATSAQPDDFYVTAENQVKFSPDLAEVKPSLDDDAGLSSESAVPKTSRRAEQLKQVGKIAFMCLAAPIFLPISLAVTLPLIPVVAVVNIGLFLADESGAFDADINTNYVANR